VANTVFDLALASVVPLSQASPVSLSQIRYFVAVAEERTWAAQRAGFASRNRRLVATSGA